MMEITQENFSADVLRSPDPVLLDFWAPWCTYCRRLAPVMEQLEQELEGKVTVARLNTDEAPVLAQQFGINVIPTLILFRNGQRSEAFVNPPSKDAILEFLEENGAAVE